MSVVKGTTIKDALAKWEEKHKCKSRDAKEVKLLMQYPPLDKMDASLSTLTCCEKLCLSTNAIEKIANLTGLKHLKILSLSRNSIKVLTGIETVAETLEELWISYNLIEKLKGVSVLKKLKILYMSNNLVKDMAEFQKLAELVSLQELLFTGNPLEESLTDYRDEVAKRLKHLKKLDGVPIIHEENDEDEA